VLAAAFSTSPLDMCTCCGLCMDMNVHIVHVQVHVHVSCELRGEKQNDYMYSTVTGTGTGGTVGTGTGTATGIRVPDAFVTLPRSFVFLPFIFGNFFGEFIKASLYLEVFFLSVPRVRGGLAHRLLLPCVHPSRLCSMVRMSGTPKAVSPTEIRSKPKDASGSHLNAGVQEWFGMYNDRPQVNDGAAAMAGLSANDNRARATGPAQWADPGVSNRSLWDEKYVPSNPAGSNPVSWVESKSGITADVRDALLAEKEGGRKYGAAEAVEERNATPLSSKASSPFTTFEPIYSARLVRAKDSRSSARAASSPMTGGGKQNGGGVRQQACRTQPGYGNPPEIEEAYWGGSKRRLWVEANAKKALSGRGGMR
jgi:hypothetical protein